LKALKNFYHLFIEINQINYKTYFELLQRLSKLKNY